VLWRQDPRLALFARRFQARFVIVLGLGQALARRLRGQRAQPDQYVRSEIIEQGVQPVMKQRQPALDPATSNFRARCLIHRVADG